MNTAENNYIYKLHTQVVYNIQRVGEAAVAFINSPEGRSNFQNIFAQWKMPIGDNMKLELGANLELNADLFRPLKVGLGFAYGNLARNEQFVVHTRLGASIPMEDNHAGNYAIDIAPSYRFKNLRLYVPFGVGINQPVTGDSNLFWNLNPYVTRTLGGPVIYGGIQLYSGTWRANGSLQTKDGISWSIPVGFRWDF